MTAAIMMIVTPTLGGSRNREHQDQQTPKSAAN
jgi:hypothetical protein